MILAAWAHFCLFEQAVAGEEGHKGGVQGGENGGRKLYPSSLQSMDGYSRMMMTITYLKRPLLLMRAVL